MTASPAERAAVGTLGGFAEIVSGEAALRALEPQLMALHECCRTSITASPAWLLGTVATGTRARPWALVVRDLDGELRGAMVLVSGAEDDTGGAWLAGSLLGHRSTILAVDADAAWTLARSAVELLRSPYGAGGGPLSWLELGPIDTRWPHLAAFLAAAPQTSVRLLDPVPVVRLRPDSSVEDYLSPGTRKTLRKARNRMSADARKRRITFTDDGAEILARLPELDACHRERDHVQGRSSELDEPWNRRVWFGRLRRLAEAGALELATLSIDGFLAAYVLGVADGDVYRVLEGHLVTRWTRYSPGRVLEAAVLERAIGDPAITALDWMTSRAPDRLLTANDAEAVIMLSLTRPGRGEH